MGYYRQLGNWQLQCIKYLTATSYIEGTGSTLSPGYVDGRVANAGLGWESTTDYGVGTDVELLKSRISLVLTISTS